MSSYKRLNKADITNYPYVANKQWSYLFTSQSSMDGDIVYYRGKKEDFNINGNLTTYNQHKSLIYNSINHLFYQSYDDILDTGSLMFNLETYESASEQRPTSSYFDYNINPLLIKNFPTSSSSEITVLSINKNIYGSKVLPHTFRISSSLFDIVDDGNGNIDNVTTCTTYELYGEAQLVPNVYQYKTCSGAIVTESVDFGTVTRCVDTSYGIIALTGSDPQSSSLGICNVQKEHVGNIFYAHGIVVVTNQDFINLLPLTSSVPPTGSNYLIHLYSANAPAVSVEPTATGSIYYKIDSGSYNFVGIRIASDLGCIDYGTISVTSGSTLFISVTTGSFDIDFGVTNTACSGSFGTPYSGSSVPYSTIISGSMDITVCPVLGTP